MNAQTWPVYQCHKRVRAAKVTNFWKEGDDHLVLMLEAESEPATFVGKEWSRIKPTQSDLGYLVSYEDGYVSWSPSKAFEEGYHHADQPVHE